MFQEIESRAQELEDFVMHWQLRDAIWDFRCEHRLSPQPRALYIESDWGPPAGVPTECFFCMDSGDTVGGNDLLCQTGPEAVYVFNGTVRCCGED